MIFYFVIPVSNVIVQCTYRLYFKGKGGQTCLILLDLRYEREIRCLSVCRREEGSKVKGWTNDLSLHGYNIRKNQFFSLFRYIFFSFLNLFICYHFIHYFLSVYLYKTLSIFLSIYELLWLCHSCCSSERERWRCWLAARAPTRCPRTLRREGTLSSERYYKEWRCAVCVYPSVLNTLYNSSSTINKEAHCRLSIIRWHNFL
jgi:hypothetical protein